MTARASLRERGPSARIWRADPQSAPSRLRFGGVYIETLIAVFIFAISIVALMSLWSTAFIQIQGANERTLAAELARANLEQAKSQGFTWLPTSASFTSSTNFVLPDKTAASYTWSSPTLYFDKNGVRQAINAPNAATYYTLVRTTTDVDIAASGGSYYVNEGGYRVVEAVVSKRKADGTTEVRARMSTRIAKGGP